MSTLRKLRRKGSTRRHRVEPLVREQFPFVGKMSEVLLDFAEPLLDTIDDDDDFKAAISFAALCWNCSFLPANKQRKQLNAIVDELGKSDPLMRLEVQDQIRMLLERKKTVFAEDRRMIANFEIVEERDGPCLLVMSTLVKSPKEANP